MANTYKAPNVYIEEISVFPPSVAEVETAIPAFIGYTEKAQRDVPDDLLNKATKIRSLKEFEQYFGFPYPNTINMTVTGNTATGFSVQSFTVVSATSASRNIATAATPQNDAPPDFLLYYSVQAFFDNGGGPCYIIPVGRYGSGATAPTIDATALTTGLDVLKLEDEPTLIVIPEAVNLASGDLYGKLVQHALDQCESLQNRFCVFDLYDGTQKPDASPPSPATGTYPELDRGYFGNNSLKYGAAYYPFLRSAFNHFIGRSGTTSFGANVHVTYDGAPQTLAEWGTPPTSPSTTLVYNTGIYNFVKGALGNYYVVLPPSGAVVGVYAAVDTSRGVWKAPANVSLCDVIEPMVKIDNDLQAGLNVDTNTGKSINAIRAFAGKGTLIWGARTLAGNDNEWRFISVRRFFIMVEASVKKSTYWAVFEPNDANTWVKVRGMIENYLTQKWRDGALAGATPKDAFYVRCGLGTTMSPDDILNGRLIVELGMAVVRPAEFIIVRFSHKMQTS